MSSPTDITLTRAQVREVDRIAMEEYAMPGLLLMENAGAGAARTILQHSDADSTIAIVCGRGNNGGDGFVIARHLHNAGRSVNILLACDPTALTGDAAVNHAIAARMHLPMTPFATADQIAATRPALSAAGVIVDALLGTGFTGPVRSPLDLAIAAINDAETLVFAVDVPSGLDCDTGVPGSATVRAHHTITFVAAKVGFLRPEAKDCVGRMHVVDIGCPAEIIRRVQATA